jgi:hypothetical protein
MDEREYQQAREQLNQCPCPFEKAVLSSRCGCVHFQRLNIAEREAAACQSPMAQARCTQLLDYFYQNAQFALKLSHLGHQLAHSKAMKLQCGGLVGLQSVLQFPSSGTFQVENIDALITHALNIFDKLEQLPYQKIIKFINHYQVRSK